MLTGEYLVNLPRGDLLETRKGSHDVFRSLGQEIIRDKISAVVHFSQQLNEEDGYEGAVYFKNGEPHLAMVYREEPMFSLDAFEFLEHHSKEMDCKISLHEANVALIYEALDAFPNSVLHFDTESDQQNIDDQWWKSVRYQTHHMKFDSTDLEHEFVGLEFAQKRHSNRSSHANVNLERGRSYSIPTHVQNTLSPILLHLQSYGFQVVEILNRQQSTSPFEHIFHSSKEHQDVEQLLEKIEEKFFGVQFGCVVLYEFELLSMVRGDLIALDILRNIADFCMESRHLFFVSFDTDLLDQKTTAKLQQVALSIDPVTLRSWSEEPDGIPVDGVFEDYDAEAEHWFEAQLEFMTHSDSQPSPERTEEFEGGSSQISDVQRAEVAQSLRGALDSFSNPSSSQLSNQDVHLNGKDWKPYMMETDIIQGKFVSESKVFSEEQVHADWQRRTTKTQPLPVRKEPKVRRVQKQGMRKPEPKLPPTPVSKITPKEISQRWEHIENFTLPSIKKPHKFPESSINKAAEYQQNINEDALPKIPLEMRGLKDGLNNSNFLEDASLPEPKGPRKLAFDSLSAIKESDEVNSLHKENKQTRNTARYAHEPKSIDEISKIWDASIKKRQEIRHTLYDERGNKLGKFGGKSS